MLYYYYLFFAIAFLSYRPANTFDHDVQPHCPPEEEVCEFDWVVDYIETMIYYDESGAGDPVVVRNGSLFRRSSCNVYIPIDIAKDADKVIFADGSYKMLFGINGHYPGPSVVVYEGQQVVMNIKNNLLMEGLTIHWHGMVQWHTPWMDGVGTVSHCPINPGETFQYRFLADPPGTHWYHSHLGTERTDGLSGALIVLPKPDKTIGLRADLPEVSGDFVMVLSDWKLDPSIETKNEVDWGLNFFSYGYNDTRCFSFTFDAAGGAVGLFPFESGLINGRGNHYLNKDNPEQPDIPELPLETFVVNRYGYYRFRVINSGMLFAFRVSVDKHDIQIISVDGNDVTMTSAESVIVYGGERVDFILLASEDVDNYWVRAQTLEVSNGDGPLVPDTALAILRYNGSREVHPKSDRYHCRPKDPCRVVNCPFGRFPDSYNIKCLAASDLKSTSEQIKAHPVPAVTSPSEIQEIFLNFHFSSTANLPFTTAVNGHVFVPPSSPPQVYPKQKNTTVSCDSLNCTDHCKCTYIVKLEKDKTVQIVFLNMDDSPLGLPHPVHMHGHHFHVLKTGYPIYNATTGVILDRNRDIRCNTKSCNDASWSNEDWKFGNVPGLNLNDPPQKDTIAIPRDGYVVVRLKADNPGFWFMHCHIENHQISGMAVLLQEGEIADMEPVPEGFPTCGSFKMTEEEFSQYMTPEGARGKKQEKQKRPENIVVEEIDYHIVDYERVQRAPYPPPSSETEQHPFKNLHTFYHHRRYHVILIVTLGVSLLLNIIFMVMCCYKKCRASSSLHKLSEKKTMLAHNLLQQTKRHSESKQRLI
uniref:Laccase-like n=1 Tax=Crassostrea virginica TaxID=6565 RepID=A0A8B8DCX4_CRAVI|nr:laccase-like [Crassostrea virginica]